MICGYGLMPGKTRDTRGHLAYKQHNVDSKSKCCLNARAL